MSSISRQSFRTSKRWHSACSAHQSGGDVWSLRKRREQTVPPNAAALLERRHVRRLIGSFGSSERGKSVGSATFSTTSTHSRHRTGTESGVCTHYNADRFSAAGTRP